MTTFFVWVFKRIHSCITSVRSVLGYIIVGRDYGCYLLMLNNVNSDLQITKQAQTCISDKKTSLQANKLNKLRAMFRAIWILRLTYLCILYFCSYKLN